MAGMGGRSRDRSSCPDQDAEETFFRSVMTVKMKDVSDIAVTQTR